MTIIYIMIFTPYFFPSIVVGREKHVGGFGSVVNLGEAKAVGNFHRLGIYRGSTYYIYIIVVDAMLPTFIQ